MSAIWESANWTRQFGMLPYYQHACIITDIFFRQDTNCHSMTLASRKRRPSYAEVATPRRDGRSSEADNKSNVKVVVRIRPENGMEKSGNFRIVVKAMNEHVLVFDPNEQSSPEYGYRHRHQRRDIRKRQNKDLKFAFDYVFDPDSVNHEIYQQTTKKILDSFLEGYNCSGKNYM